MLSIKPAVTTSYVIPSGTIFDEDVSVWTLVKYIFKVMFAFIIVNVILTLPVVLLAMVAVAALTGSAYFSGAHLPAAGGH